MPRENTIWVNSQNAPTRPNYSIGYHKPSNASIGDVFIEISINTLKYVNLTKDGKSQLRIGGCFIWSGVVWEPVDCQVFVDGAWRTS